MLIQFSRIYSNISSILIFLSCFLLLQIVEGDPDEGYVIYYFEAETPTYYDVGCSLSVSNAGTKIYCHLKHEALLKDKNDKPILLDTTNLEKYSIATRNGKKRYTVIEIRSLKEEIEFLTTYSELWTNTLRHNECCIDAYSNTEYKRSYIVGIVHDVYQIITPSKSSPFSMSLNKYNIPSKVRGQNPQSLELVQSKYGGNYFIQFIPEEHQNLLKLVFVYAITDTFRSIIRVFGNPEDKIYFVKWNNTIRVRSSYPVQKNEYFRVVDRKTCDSVVVKCAQVTPIEGIFDIVLVKVQIDPPIWTPFLGFLRLSNERNVIVESREFIVNECCKSDGKDPPGWKCTVPVKDLSAESHNRLNAKNLILNASIVPNEGNIPRGDESVVPTVSSIGSTKVEFVLKETFGPVVAPPEIEIVYPPSQKSQIEADQSAIPRPRTITPQNSAVPQPGSGFTVDQLRRQNAEKPIKCNSSLVVSAPAPPLLWKLFRCGIEFGEIIEEVVPLTIFVNPDDKFLGFTVNFPTEIKVGMNKPIYVLTSEGRFGDYFVDENPGAECARNEIRKFVPHLGTRQKFEKAVQPEGTKVLNRVEKGRIIRMYYVSTDKMNYPAWYLILKIKIVPEVPMETRVFSNYEFHVSSKVLTTIAPRINSDIFTRYVVKHCHEDLTNHVFALVKSTDHDKKVVLAKGHAFEQYDTKWNLIRVHSRYLEIYNDDTGFRVLVVPPSDDETHKDLPVVKPAATKYYFQLEFESLTPVRSPQETREESLGKKLLQPLYSQCLRFYETGENGTYSFTLYHPPLLGNKQFHLHAYYDGYYSKSLTVEFHPSCMSSSYYKLIQRNGLLNPTEKRLKFYVSKKFDTSYMWNSNESKTEVEFIKDRKFAEVKTRQ